MTDTGAEAEAEIAAQVQSISTGLAAVPSSDRLGYLKAALDRITSKGVRDAVTVLLTVSPSLASREQIVVLLHGIRTRAAWFEPLAALLSDLPGVSAVPIRYGYFDAVRFYLPLLRRGVISRIREQLATVVGDNRQADISVIAHSFGTYAICRILDTDPSIRLHRLVLCGAIVPPRFKFHRIAGRVARPTLNECGVRDMWPVLATSTLGYGASGTFGFEHTHVLNRFHDLTHSGFFSEDFYRQAWVPLWANGGVDPKPSSQRPPSPWFISVAGFIPLRWVVFLGLLLAIWWFARLAVGATR